MKIRILSATHILVGRPGDVTVVADADPTVAGLLRDGYVEEAPDAEPSVEQPRSETMADLAPEPPTADVPKGKSR